MNNFTKTSQGSLGMFGRWWNFLTAPHSSITDVTEQRAARLAASFLFTITMLNLVGALASIPSVGISTLFAPSRLLALFVIIPAYFLARTKWYRVAVFIFSVAFSSLAYIAIISQGNEVDYATQILIYVPLSLIVASAFVSSPAVFLLLGLNIGAYFSIQAFGVDLPRNIAPQVGILTVIGLVIMLLTNFRDNTEKIRLDALREANLELESLTTGLEQRVADRTKALSTSAEVSRRLSTILNQKELIEEVVTQVQQSFDYYHAHIYLVDGDELLMAGGTGEAGEKMLATGHKLIKGRGIVGRAAENNEPVLVQDVSKSIGWLTNPLLPDTKSEAAVPISVGGQVVGVLDVQHNIVDGLDENDVILLQSLASQIAIALQNARQYEENLRFRLGIENSGDAIFTTDTNGTITYANPAFEKVYGYASTEVIGQNPRIIKSGLLSQEVYQQFWNTILSKQSVTGEIVNKHKNGHLVYIAGTNSAIVNDAGEISGFLAVHHDITEEKTNQKLTERRASQQEAINMITQKIQGTTSMQEALQITARELGHALGSKSTLVSLNTPEKAATQEVSTSLTGDEARPENLQ